MLYDEVHNKHKGIANRQGACIGKRARELQAKESGARAAVERLGCISAMIFGGCEFIVGVTTTSRLISYKGRQTTVVFLSNVLSWIISFIIVRGFRSICGRTLKSYLWHVK